MLSAILHEPLVVWTLRSFLAALFLTAALSKLTAIDEFHGVVRNFRLLPDGLARPAPLGLGVDCTTYGALIGAHMMGHEVTEMIQGFVTAIAMEATEEDIHGIVYPHPTMSEAMHEAALDAYGRVIRELAKNPGTPGDEVVLTLDMDIQRYATERVRGESASIVVMDVVTGELVSIVSAPGFDPNLFNIGLSQAEWEGLTNNELNPLVNKTLAGQYPPGSTFKMVVALAALDAGVIAPNRTIFCSGKVSLGSHDFHCWKRGGHGPMDMVDAIKHSCNVYFYEIGKRLGIDKIEKMARRFGLGDQLAVDMAGEKAGNIPSAGWKRATTGVPWQQGETLNASIGQGYVLTTPLQLATMAARIANGGTAVRPWLVRSVGGQLREMPQAVPMGIPPAHVSIIQRGMNEVVNVPGGTAFRSRLPLENAAMAGKTGTALVRRISREERARGVLKNDELPWKFRDHALFVGYGPVENPRYAISVIVDHGGGGSAAAAPVAKDVMTRVLTRDPMNMAAYEQVPGGGGLSRRAALTGGRSGGGG